MDPNAIAKGVADALGYWLNDHEISFPEMLERCAKEAFKQAAHDFLESNRDEVLNSLRAGVNYNDE